MDDMTSEQDREEQAREEVREKMRQSLEKLSGDDAKPVEELRGHEETPPVPITKSG
ncbi:MAG TPA: hypothetical protein VIO84_05680 [Candidatus Dormibacteraeota bacterium]